MSYIDSPPEVFHTILRYFEKRWNNNANLSKIECTATADFRSCWKFIDPSDKLYFRMTTNLAPFMFEVPRAFGAFEKLLTD